MSQGVYHGIWGEHIWNNSMIRIAGKTVFYKHWANAGEKSLENVLIKLNSSSKPSQAAYKILMTKKCTRPEKSQNKWIKDCGLVDVENFGLGVNLSTTKDMYIKHEIKELPVQISPQENSYEFFSV